MAFVSLVTYACFSWLSKTSAKTISLSFQVTDCFSRLQQRRDVKLGKKGSTLYRTHTRLGLASGVQDTTLQVDNGQLRKNNTNHGHTIRHQQYKKTQSLER